MTPEQNLTRMLDAMHPISEGLEQHLQQTGTLRKQSLKSNEMIHRPHGNTDEAHYIDSGLCKVYWKNSDNEEMIFGFFCEDEIALLPEEFITESRNGDMYLETLVETEIYTITKEQMKEIYKEYPEALILTDIIVSNIYRKRKRQLWILLRPEGCRYEWFCAWFPELRYLLSDKDIAAYLGVSKSTLTRSKRELLNKEWRRNK